MTAARTRATMRLPATFESRLAVGAVLTGRPAIQFGVIELRAPVQWVTVALLAVLLGPALPAR